ncbi:MAG: hypothetical protein NTW93_01355 [Phycisphaerae bacterium]|nr:hypothetical protein [Phycisphaerae bacterium]
MLCIIGCGLVCVAFILMRFVAPHQTKINHRFVMVLWLGFLIGGLILAFLSDIGLCFIAFGSFLWLYYPSFGERYIRDISARFYGVPIFANQIAQNLGFVLLLTGLILLFLHSVLYGFISIVVVFVVVQVLGYLRRVESKLIEKEVSKHDR